MFKHELENSGYGLHFGLLHRKVSKLVLCIKKPS